MSDLGIYIHVPFCAQKCPYCDFYSGSYTASAMDAYINALIRNFKAYSESICVDTVYFGGGTPSLLNGTQLQYILDELKKSFRLNENAEITIEANPSTLNFNKLCEYKSAGVNRLSLGVQSLNSSELEFLGRHHTPERALKAVCDAQKAGFENISCDLMIGLPKQTEDEILSSIKQLASLDITHFSSYILKIEEGTPFYKNNISDKLPDDDYVSELYLQMCEMMKSYGYEQYEISNFAKESYQSRHNNRYWKCQDYIGIGPAAHSCYNGARFAVKPDLNDFISAPKQNVTITDDNPYTFEEKAMLRLRLSEGLLLSECGEKADNIIKKADMLEKSGYISFDGKKIALTSKGFVVSNSIIEYLIFE
ncbi:MAG: radical SAM family heme chaperone HemW [Ruminococcus sp.]|nr:radical SAM family heme chaperone HemW [Ruminococcus sp.]MBO5384364.1 radical SAM family heme chaperone HemW [Ruminococcus sp.]